jgi:hypothetical protein
MYVFLAEVVVFIHLVYIGIVIGGLLLVVLGAILRWQWIRNPWLRGLHLCMIMVVAFEATIGFECPLTTWENQLRAAAGEQVEEGSFMSKLMGTLLHPGWATEQTLTYGSYGFALLILLTLVAAPPRLRHPRPVRDPASPLAGAE